MKRLAKLIGYGHGGFIVDDTTQVLEENSADYIYFDGILYNVRIHQSTLDGTPIYGIRWAVSKYELENLWFVVEHFNIDLKTYSR